MGYTLLWIENLAVAWLLAAVLVAWTSRGESRWRRLARIGAAVVLILVGLFDGAIAGYAAALWIQGEPPARRMAGLLLFSSLVFAAAYMLGAALLAVRGWRRPKGDPHAPRRAAAWPCGGLAAALAAALALHGLTVLSMDLAVRQRLAEVRTEAQQLARSVSPQRPRDDQNAAVLYEQVFEGWGQAEQRGWPDVWRHGVDALDDGRYVPRPKPIPPDQPLRLGDAPKQREFDFASSELAAFLQQRAGELEVLREAAARPVCYFEKDFGRPSFDMLLPEIQDLRSAARLLALDARHQAAVGRTDLALADVNAMFGVARHAGQCPFLVSCLVAVAIDGMSVRTLEQVLQAAEADEQQLAALRLDPSFSFRRVLVRALRMEEAGGTLLFCAIGSPQENRGLFNQLEAGPSVVNLTPFATFYRVWWLPGDLAAYRQYMRQAQRQLALLGPYAEIKKSLEQLERDLVDRRWAPLTSLVTPALSAAAEARARADAYRRAALVGWAARRYVLRHGGPPERIEQLVPELLNVLPRDPFDGQLIRLKETEEGLVAYSVGPDGKDDGGAPLQPQDRSGDVRFVVPLATP